MNEKIQWDVVVYGGTSAGVIAGVQAARMGKKTILIEPGRHIGGLTSGGLGMTDSGEKKVIGGLSLEFYKRVKQWYDDSSVWIWQNRSDYPHYVKNDEALFRFEPKVAEKILRNMADESGLSIVFGERLNRSADGIRMTDTRIDSVVMESGKIFDGKFFIDATYEGDLMALAGVGFHVGRESNDLYGETLNGVQTGNAVQHQFLYDIDPYVVPGNPSSGLISGVRDIAPGIEYSADSKIQAYNYRMCLTDNPENRIPFPKPEGYRREDYELLARYIEAMPEWRDVFGNHQAMPNDKTDTNNHGGFGTDFIGMNWEYPEGDYVTREHIIQEHLKYQQGFMWFLCNEQEPRIPDALREEVRRWGLAADEFVDSGNWPHQLYIREARRMVSDYVHTELDCKSVRETPESVGMGSYNMDSHNTQRYVDSEGHVRNEGDVQVSPGDPYKISYKSIRPKAEECTNLFVPVCLSSSHIAYGSVRMEPVFMILGQSAATAACIAIDEEISAQEVDYKKLRRQLIADKQVLEK